MEVEMLRIVVGPDNVMSGSCFNVMLKDSEGDWDALATGGTARGPRDDENPDAWLAWAKRQVAGEIRKRIAWSKATVKPFGWSLGAGHAPQGIEILVPTLG
jgi:hypothetical protein